MNFVFAKKGIYILEPKCYKSYVMYVTNMSRPSPPAPCGLRGCKNGPAPFPGRMSYKATKPGLVFVLYLSIFLLC